MQQLIEPWFAARKYGFVCVPRKALALKSDGCSRNAMMRCGEAILEADGVLEWIGGCARLLEMFEDHDTPSKMGLSHSS
jgi:hypothetical protein